MDRMNTRFCAATPTDITAMALAMDNDMTMVCFGLDEENSIVRVVCGDAIGTTVKNKF